MTTIEPSPVVHGTFRIERTYPASPQRVFAAFANSVTKRRWFAEGEGFVVDTFTVDFRVGGREIARFRQEGSDLPLGNDTIYLDIVDEQRIVFVYTMTAGAACISASLATIEIAPDGRGAGLVYTEQGAFFGGGDGPTGREAGCRELFDRLGEALGTDQTEGRQ